MRRLARVILDELDPEPKEARKAGFRLRGKLDLSPPLQFGEQLVAGDSDLDDSGVGSYAPVVELLISAGIFSQDFGGDLHAGVLIVGRLANPVIESTPGLVADGFE